MIRVMAIFLIPGFIRGYYSGRGVVPLHTTGGDMFNRRKQRSTALRRSEQRFAQSVISEALTDSESSTPIWQDVVVKIQSDRAWEELRNERLAQIKFERHVAWCLHRGECPNHEHHHMADQMTRVRETSRT